MFLYLRILLILFVIVFLTNCQNDPYKHGAILYENFCSNCHGMDGNGLGKNIPPLVGSQYLNEPIKMGCIIRNGISGEIEVNGVKYNEKMPPVEKLSDYEIANVINFILQKWGNQKYVQINHIQDGLKNCK